MGLVAGALAGAAGGALGSALMNLFQARPHGAQGHQTGQPQHGVGRLLAESGRSHAGDDATERTAAALSPRPLSEREKHERGRLAHYAFGIGSATVYGALVELWPQAKVGYGLPFGTVVWLGADEGVVPLLGLSRRPSEFSAGDHARSLLLHFLYGLVTEATRRALTGEREPAR